MLYTTYFARLKKLPKNIVPISICGKAPQGYTGLQYKKLAPKYDFFMKWKQNHDDAYYIDCFNKQVLSPLNADSILAELQTMAGQNTDIALVCYEKPSDFCHRHLVAKWFNEYNIPCEEYNYEVTQ